MKYPYSCPNLRLTDLIAAAGTSGNTALNEITSYFKKLTGKKYILITNSCRSALYLGYKAMNKTGEVITSPLTCKVAIDPIEESGNHPVFADINLSNLNINPGDITPRINRNTIAIQVIHLGGVSCDMDQIQRIARENDLFVIEDCAQSLGAKYSGKYTGAFGDISCFSLIKNAYGIGGGILATNSDEIYINARNLSNTFPKPARMLISYRIVRNLIDTKRKSAAGRLLFNALMKLKGNRSNYQSVAEQLYKITGIEKKIAARQISRFDYLHRRRKDVGETYYDILLNRGLFSHVEYQKDGSSYTKLFLYNPKYDSRRIVEALNGQGIEAMHLEHKNGSPYQERLISEDRAVALGLGNYNKVHDTLVSLPVSEYLKKDDIEYIIERLESIHAN
jgi:dTDP-4-amino-4,6-dideoxygalactose transaminase